MATGSMSLSQHVAWPSWVRVSTTREGNRVDVVASKLSSALELLSKDVLRELLLGRLGKSDGGLGLELSRGKRNHSASNLHRKSVID